MGDNPVRNALLARTLTVGTWIQIGHAASAEIMSLAGYDWMAVDCEHTDIDLATLTHLLRGMTGPVPMVRVRENDTLAIRQVLDAGAQGVIVPLVSSADEARRAVAAAKYPPQGIRGHCFARMNDYGRGFDDYARRANENIPVVVMIETQQAVENIAAILAVDGVDGIFIGPYDLSASYGIPGQTQHPLIMEARRRVLAACARAGKSAGLHVVIPTPEAIQGAVADGFTFVAIGADSVFLREASRHALEVAHHKGGGVR